MTEISRTPNCKSKPVMNRSGEAQIHRRTVLRSAALAAAAYAVSGPLTGQAPLTPAMAQTKKSTFVLVHGAWHGGWCWKRVKPLLRAADHDVHSPTLTGLGDRSHLFSKDIDLNLHIQDVVNMLEMEGLSDITLVGHSYGGIVISGVADRVASRIKQLVYLDAFVPKDGMSLADFFPPKRRTPFVEKGRKQGYYDPLPVKKLGVVKPDDIEWVGPRLVKQSAKTFLQPVSLKNPAAAKLPRTFIYCSQSALGTFDRLAASLRKNSSWKFFELKTGHDAMVLDPEGLTKILLRIA